MTEEIAKALVNLGLIEKHLGDYENEERIAPTAEVVAAVREFLNALNSESDGPRIPEPRLFVSPNGHIVVEIGARPYKVIIRFRTKVTFCYWHPRLGDGKGEGVTNAMNAVKGHFQEEVED